MMPCKLQVRQKLKLQGNVSHLLCLPEAVEDVAIRINSQHDIVGGGVMDERALRVHKEHVRDPNLLHQATVKGHALVVSAGEGQPLVLPVVA